MTSADPTRQELRRFITFGGVGVIGFLVDASVLSLGIAAGLGLQFGRIVSYLAAVTTTWGLNRVFTFRVSSNRSLWAEWAQFSVSQLGGAAANLGMYYLLIQSSPTVAQHPVIGVAAGSLSGLVLNYAVARFFVFRRALQGGPPRGGALAVVVVPGSARPAKPPGSPVSGLLLPVVLLLAFVWPALFNGQAFFFPDTTTYIRGADAGLQAAFHLKSAWSSPPGADRPGGGLPSVSSIEDKTVLTGRSPYYGSLLYVGDLAGGFWLTVLLQAAALLGALGLALRALHLPAWPQGFLIGLAIAAATTAPFFSSLLMPDVFAGIAILTAAVLLSVRERLATRDYLLAFVLLSAAVTFHDSHSLILAVMLGFGLAQAAAAREPSRWVGAAVIAAALAIGALSQIAFAAAVRHVVGAPPLRPPFLMARTIEDGPGLKYLRATCPGNGFKVCQFADRLPLTADDFLWNLSPRGVFAVAPPATRRALSAEQLRFVASVFAFDPWAQLSASFGDAVLQIPAMKLTEFQYTDLEKAEFAAKLPAAPLSTLQASAAYRGDMPVGFLNAWQAAIVLLSSLTVVACFARAGGGGGRWQRPEARLVSWMVLGFFTNAAVCGVLSGPHDRYSARVAWLLPLAALLFVTSLVRQRAAPEPAALV